MNNNTRQNRHATLMILTRTETMPFQGVAHGSGRAAGICTETIMNTIRRETKASRPARNNRGELMSPQMPVETGQLTSSKQAP